MKWNKRALLLHMTLLTFSMSFAACNNGETQQPTDTEVPASAEIARDEPAVGYDVTFRDESGKIVSLASLKGKVVFINFWATWCPPCIHEMPSINQLKKSFEGNEDIVFLMVDVEGNIEKSTAFMKKNNYDLTVYVPDSQIPGDFLGSAIPTTVILDKEGTMVGRIQGGRDYSSPAVKNALDDLLRNKETEKK